MRPLAPTANSNRKDKMKITSEWEDLGCVAIFVAASMLCANAQAGPVTLGIGLDYAKGKYGEPTTTEDFYIPFSLTYQHGAWKTKLVVPFLAIRGNGEVVGGPRDRIVDDQRSSNSGSGNSGSEFSYTPRIRARDNLFRVELGPYASRSDAQRAAVDLEARFGVVPSARQR